MGDVTWIVRGISFLSLLLVLVLAFGPALRSLGRRSGAPEARDDDAAPLPRSDGARRRALYGVERALRTWGILFTLGGLTLGWWSVVLAVAVLGLAPTSPWAWLVVAAVGGTGLVTAGAGLALAALHPGSQGGVVTGVLLVLGGGPTGLVLAPVVDVLRSAEAAAVLSSEHAALRARTASLDAALRREVPSAAPVLPYLLVGGTLALVVTAALVAIAVEVRSGVRLVEGGLPPL